MPQQCLTSSPSAFSTPESTTTTTTAAASSSVVAEPTPTATTQHDELDADGNDLTTGSFMSFEEWKAMMLEKSGQEALEPKHRKTKDSHGEAYPGEDFGSLGDEGEVSLDFDAYSDKISEITSATRPSKNEERQVEKVTYDEGLAQGYRSKDAGKTCKERFSYASFDGGATVLKASPGAKNPKAILVENKDSYMLLECAMENKFFVVELSDDILVDTVVIANFEFFSSMIRHFRVSVSDRYPVKIEKWKILGTFEARNSRDIQPFLVENPQIWAKYIRVEIVSHYGNEYYCPVSLFRVHGTRMLDSWKEADPAYLEGEDDASKTGSEGVEEATEAADAPPEEVEVAEPPQPETQIVNSEQSEWMRYWDESYFSYKYPFNVTCAVDDMEDSTSQLDSEEHDQKAAEAKPQPAWTVEQAAPSSSEAGTVQSTTQTATESAKTASSSGSSETIANTAVANSTESTSISTSSSDARSTVTSSSSAPTTITPPSVSKTASVQAAPKGKTTASTSVKPPSSKSAASKGQQQQPSGSPTTPRSNKTTTTTSSAASSPTVQDSFFKALQKRLQSLESNTTLSLQYIESQSRFLQDALARLERRQVAKVDLFLDTLNKTVLGELRDVRTLYDELWQSTVIALETQRDQSERELVALGSRLGVLADEVVFQKRMAIVQSLLLLGCLVLVIFSRGGFGATAVESYYNNNFPVVVGGGGGAFSSSRIASPVFPSTPKGHHHHSAGKDDPSPNVNGALLSVDDASPLGASAATTPQSSRLRRSPSQTSDSLSSPSSLRHRPRTNSRAGDGSSSEGVHHRRRPSPSRTATEPAAAAAAVDHFFRVPTPSSGVEIGYDSEPAMAHAGDHDGDGDYYAGTTTTAARGVGVSENDVARNGGPSGYLETLARRSERQLTPSSESDSIEYMPPLSSRPGLTHTTSARKPLPALPEDPD